MRRLAAGVTVITTSHGGKRGGLTATAVCSLSAAPPQILVCVNRTASAHDMIAEGTNLCVNLLSRSHQQLAWRFAGAVEGEERFRTGKWTTLTTGAPVLADALACFDCEVSEKIESATHTIFIGKVVGVSVREKGKPLLYASGAFAGLKKLETRRRHKTVVRSVKQTKARRLRKRV